MDTKTPVLSFVIGHPAFKHRAIVSQPLIDELILKGQGSWYPPFGAN